MASCSLLNEAVRRNTGLEVEAEYRFHPVREWRFDYAIPRAKVAIEVEGGVWNHGRHTRPEGYLRDLEKYNEAAACGWLLIRTTPSELLTVKTLRLVARAVGQRIENTQTTMDNFQQQKKWQYD